ncbi:COP-coated vesicle membrane protein gp25L precursor [Leishmania infantum JPCM5]|uniref:COP-coated_vesicle_membrane_protein_gp25L_precursor_-_putative n=2 Tax=Leishmania infantum TaxID=5671 RepID=A0A6L0Y0A6_LEIIN|nr:COP-coated vesicle membrane protein gp25L precursor [Leishmania infantum JPCM5]CAC9544299.1 COP-coated_vesicle_membrane_protein_gp25L_precursor_-_putative [Leishmania infantum]CAM72099.1 COP-coated vesicle membrane protein gp25L precursor [Leishmania infantum JPCM5]SUZ46013.1 COP-coated_vesicle_membrane_protein_gp25L_precursor_-_putative [Leishmania infantum]|eukprot:XP_001469004.1 COP-coated vesicle membrane protein gp25L precursor [Leishmania infantum JPCM5]
MARRGSTSLAAASTAALLVLVLSSTVNGFVFQLESGKSRCFLQEVASGTDLRIVYKADDTYGDFLDVVLTNANGNTLYRELGKSSGAFLERITNGGEHSLCFTSRQGAQSAKMTRSLLLVMQLGADAKDYDTMATKEKMRPMEVQMRMMEDTVQEVHNEFVYFRAREAEMRNTNEHMTAKVMWMSVALIILFGVFWYLQMRHLKRYFKKKRMID